MAPKDPVLCALKGKDPLQLQPLLLIFPDITCSVSVCQASSLTVFKCSLKTEDPVCLCPSSQCVSVLNLQSGCCLCDVCRLSALPLAVEQTKVCRKLLSAQGLSLLRLALSRKKVHHKPALPAQNEMDEN